MRLLMAIIVAVGGVAGMSLGAIAGGASAALGVPQRAEDPVGWAGAVERPGGIKLEISVKLSKDSGTISIPQQGVKDQPLSDVAVDGASMTFGMKFPGAPDAALPRWELKIAADGASAEGVLKQNGGEFPTKLKRLAAGEAPPTMKRPQEPRAPFPYVSDDVTFENKPAGITLAGTLARPSTPGPHPAVVMITGSGPQDRDEALLGHKPFLVISDYLVRRGIAVLRFDDRGTAGSKGDFAAATSDDFATDALAGVEFLKGRAEIDGRRIGLVGHSEGGLIAPIVASESPDVAFIVLLAGTGVPGTEILALQGKLISVAMGMPEAQAEQNAVKAKKLYDMLAAGAADADVSAAVRVLVLEQLKATPEGAAMTEEALAKSADAVTAQQVGQLNSKWFRRFFALDPREYLKKVKCPVLAINGSLDLQVPPSQNLPEIEKAVKAGGNTDVTVMELPGLNHLFQHSATGAPSEYASIEETFAPEALELVAVWIREKTGLK